MHDFAKKQKLLEINPRSPLVEGLLRRVKQLPTEEEERDLDAEDELREVAAVLIDGALVRSGFSVADSNAYVFLRAFFFRPAEIFDRFFTRVDRILRRSLGVSESAPTDTRVRPAPPVDPKLPEDEKADDPVHIDIPEHLQDQVKWEVEEIDEEGNPVKKHDEL